VRPTAARVREALFSIVGQDLAGQRILDACGGTGLVAFEAASRGAEALVTERDPVRARAIAASAAALGLPVRAVQGDAAMLSPALGQFTGIYLDPPYDVDPAPLLAALAPRANGWLALESRAAAPSPAPIGGFALDPVRTYGEAALRIYRRAAAAGRG
jgi:16S rRNA (guanine(966)-N(2))-methyltransferase RsmD